jgi:ABC-type branched-subunit amino acid transport system substrate-binding protein
MRYALLAFTFYLFALTSLAQSTDPQAIELIRQGRLKLENNNFPAALEDFAAAAKLPNHNRSVQASYLAGLAAYYQGDYQNAIAWFDYLIRTFPPTSYASEAIYHKGLAELHLNDMQSQVSGLKDLFFLFENTATPIDMRTSALSAIRQYTFHELEPTVLEYMFQQATPGQAPLIAEALCTRYLKSNQQWASNRVINSLNARGIPQTAYLMKLTGPRTRLHYYEPGIIKLAMMLPLHLNADGSTSTDPKGAMGRGFYEGFRLATRDYQRRARKRIYLKVFDTKRKPELVERQLAALESLYPDMILGDIFNTPSETISDWCHQRGIPQLSPLSPTLNTEGKPLLFQGHPSIETQARKMAEYARNSLNLNKIVVWSDGRALTDRLANTYASTFLQMGGEVVWMRVDSSFYKAKGQILGYISTRARVDEPDGHYIPLPSEEMCGLILSELNYRRMKHTIMGSPNWQYFEAIDRGLMERYGLIFSTTYFVDEQAISYKALVDRFKQDFKHRPTADHIMGYDFGLYVLYVLDQYDYRSGVTLDQFLRNHQLQTGFHLGFHFNGSNDNQFVHICRFGRKGYEKLQ